MNPSEARICFGYSPFSANKLKSKQKRGLPMNEISLNVLIKIFKKTWWKILIVTLIVMMLAASFTHFFIPKKYSSSIKFYVINSNADYDYTSSTVISAVTYLINDYISIIKSDLVLDKVVDELKEDNIEITKAQILSMISTSIAEETSVFTMTFTSTDKQLAYDVASAIAEIAPATVTAVAKSDENTNRVLAEKILFVIEKLGLDKNDPITETHVESVLSMYGVGLSEQATCMEVLTPPVEDTVHDSPNIITYTLLSGVLAAVATYAFFLIVSVLNQSVVTEEDVKRLINRPLIGTIPHWETVEKN